MTPTSTEYFDRMWSSDDPWDQANRFSELRKYDITVACLPAARYRRAFEPGCATGILTEKLAHRCDRVLAVDRHPHAVELTARRTAALANVTTAVGQLPEVPQGPFDLVVLSEVLYYLTEADVRLTLERAAEVTNGGGHLVAVHFRPYVPEHALRGDAVHTLLREAPGWRQRITHAEPDFLLDVMERG